MSCFMRRIVQRILAVSGIIVLFGGAGLAVAVPNSELPDMELLTSYATFGNNFNDHNVTINGDSGISNDGTLSLGGPSSITGDLDLGTGAKTSKFDGTVGGTISSSQDLAAAQAQVYAAAQTLAGLMADFTYTNLMSGVVIKGNGEVTVINVTENVDLGSGENIVFTGGSNDYFVLNIFGDLDMGGNAAIKGDGVDESRILINLLSSDSLGNIAHVDNVINGTLLIPYATYAELHSVNGAIYSGEGEVKLMSGSTVTYQPYSPPTNVPDGGSSALLMAVAMVALATAGALWRRASRP